MSLYAAIDLHSNNGVLSIIDSEDRVQYERRLPNDLSAVLGALEPFREQIVAIAIESTYNWYWLADGLQDHGYHVVLANPARVAIHFTHRLGAMVAGSILIALGLFAAASARSAASHSLRRAGLLLVAAVALQICIGVATVHFGVPLTLATLHNAGAAFLVLSMVCLLRALWPAPAIGVVPLHRADSPR